MKKIIFAICFLVLGASAVAQQDSLVNDFLNKTTISATDIVPFQITSGGNWYWRKITGASIWGQIRDTTKAYNYADLDLSNSFNGINDFDGATFNAGAHGTVTFNDSTVVPSTSALYVGRLYPYNATSFIGSSGSPIYSIHTRLLYVMNAAGDDSIGISYDETNDALSVTKLTVTESVSVDSSATFNTFAFTPHSYTIPNVGDTILTLSSSDKYSCIELDLPGDLTTGISRIYVEGAQKGMILRIYNGDSDYSPAFIDYVGSDDNLYMSADFTSMGLYDFIEFQCVVESIIGQAWMETGRSNN